MGKKSKLQKYLESQEFVIKNECAISLVSTKLKIIGAQLSMNHDRQVIYSISSRIKSYESLIGKIKRKKLSGEIPMVLDKINDLAGVRVVCTYTDDLYQIADRICCQKDIEVLKRKDYIKNPKSSGYRSLHLILQVPIQFEDREEKIKIEVQLRTSAMDYWAELDYQLQYKKEYQSDKDQDTIQEIKKELKDYASVIENIDKQVLELRNKIEAL
ncbi:MAG: GTP pyrophosphokinase [Lachnospiraceae bacterium]|nr:GTP pyrophosphokinase [Lachnospiraceae bacterium]